MQHKTFWRIMLLPAFTLFFTGCADRPLASEFSRVESYTLTDTADTKLNQAVVPHVKAHRNQSGFRLLPSGTGALLARLSLVEAAEKSIDLQYYSTREDTTGKLLLEAVLRAADRGVRVRVLLDDWNLNDFRKGAAALNTHPNIEIRVFNPVALEEEGMFARVRNLLTNTNQFTKRMHNKALIVDNIAAIIGGRNLGDEYFDAASEFNFTDLDVFSAGPVTAKISHSFDKYWNSEDSYPLAALRVPAIDADDVKKMRFELEDNWAQVASSEAGKVISELHLVQHLQTQDPPLMWAYADLAADEPEKINQPVEHAESQPIIKLDSLLDNAKKEFVAISPYLVPLDDGVDWLTAPVKRGVKVKIVTNSLSSTDVVPVHSGYSHYREGLVAGGVELYEMKPVGEKKTRRPMFKASSRSRSSLHAKVYMVDKKEVIIGSFNLDPRSIQLNTEMALIIHSAEIAARIEEIFAKATHAKNSYHVFFDGPEDTKQLVWETEDKNGEIKRYTRDPEAGFWRNTVATVFSVLPVDEKL